MKKFFLGYQKDYDESKYVVLSVPMELSVSYGKGTSLGPEKILEASVQLEENDFEFSEETYKYGIHTLTEPLKSNSADSYIKLIKKEVSKIVKDGKIPIVLGGEHSLSYGVFEGIKEHFSDFSIIHFDSHLDLRDSYENSKYSHASVMKRIYENLPANNEIISIGIRSVSSEEKDFIKDKKLNIIYAHNFYEEDINTLLNNIKNKLSKNLFITFDVDAFDPSVMPSTGTPEPGGLFWYHVVNFLRDIMKGRNLLGADFVELAPDNVNHFSEFTVAKLIYKIIGYDLFLGEK